MPAGTGLTCAGSSASRCNATPLTPRWLRSWRGCWTYRNQPLPALHQEQRRRRQRVLLGVAGAALGISFAMAALAAVALHQRGVANDRLRQAQYQQSMSLSALADLKVTEGDGTAAQLLASKSTFRSKEGRSARLSRWPRPPYTAPPWPGVSATSSTPLRAHRSSLASRTVPPDPRRAVSPVTARPSRC